VDYAELLPSLFELKAGDHPIVVTYFGSEGLVYAYDFAGNLKWKAALGGIAVELEGQIEEAEVVAGGATDGGTTPLAVLSGVGALVQLHRPADRERLGIAWVAGGEWHPGRVDVDQGATLERLEQLVLVTGTAVRRHVAGRSRLFTGGAPAADGAPVPVGDQRRELVAVPLEVIHRIGDVHGLFGVGAQLAERGQEADR
jgi:hypothetical protein